MATFLLEVGTEELPADFARFVLPQLENMIRCDLRQRRINHGTIKCTSTPRRIVLIVEGLAVSASDSEEERKGPPSNQAFKNGSPTKAAIGFAKRYEVDPSKLEVRETSKGSFVFAKVLERGEPTLKLLSEMIPEWIQNIQGRRFMRWGVGERRFSRPIRWLVALLDQTLIPVSLPGTDPEISSGRKSRGHRLNKSDVLIDSADEYFSRLTEAGVVVDRDRRAAVIRSSIEEAASELNAVPDLSEDLLEELTDLVESPELIRGSFDDSFLDLPAEVLCTVMRVHQRYVPLYLDNACIDPLSLNAKKNLLPAFLCIANGLPSAKDSIQLGNQRVLKARLADAEFFRDADLSVKSINRMEELNRVTFAEGLGTLKDRVSRLEWVARTLVYELNISNIELDNVLRAVKLCKNDLVSQMVVEFPELQGIMGAKYLLAEGETKQVALAVLEHYLPRTSGDKLPNSDSGAVLALAERLELLISIFAKGERPSGSSDPYALRRAGNGVLQILWSKGWRLDINSLLGKAIGKWFNILPNLNINNKKLYLDLGEFFRQRLSSLLEEAGVDGDLVQAVAGQTISVERLLADPEDIRIRAELLVKMRKSNELSFVQAVVTRASRLAEKIDLDKNILSADKIIDPVLFEKSSELNMLKVINSLEPIVKSKSNDRYSRLAKGLAAGSEALSSFFDGDESVMVMTDDLDIRSNRLNLLGIICNQASILADFDQIRN